MTFTVAKGTMKRVILLAFAVFGCALSAQAQPTVGVSSFPTIAAAQALGPAISQYANIEIKGGASFNDGAQGFFAWVPGSAASVDGCTIYSVPGANGRLIRLVSTEVSLSWCSLSTSTSDRATNRGRIQAMATMAGALGVPLVGKKYSACVPISEEIEVSGDFFANGMCISALGAAGSFPSGAVVYADGDYDDLGALDASVSAYSTSFTLATTPPAAVVPGSLLFIVDQATGSFNAARSYYTAGEAVIVESVSGDVVTLTKPLKYAYANATTSVALLDPYTGVISGLTVEGVSALSGAVPIRVRMAGPGSAIVDCIGYTSAEAGVQLIYSYGTTIKNSGSVNIASTFAGVNYGLSLANVSNVVVDGGTWYGRRHGVTFGGTPAIPELAIVSTASSVSRAVIGTIQGGGADAVVAADAHGDTDAVSFLDNTINGGINIGGTNNRVERNNITCGTGYSYSQYCVQVTEPLSINHWVRNNNFDLLGNSSNSSYATLLDFNASGGGIPATNTQDGTFHFTGNTVSYYITNGTVADVFLVNARNGGSTAEINLDFTNNTFALTGADTDTARGVLVNSVSGSDWTNVDISGTRGNVSFNIQDTVNVTAANNTLSVSGADYTSSSAALAVNGATGVVSISDFVGVGGNDGAIKVDGTAAPTVIINGVSTVDSAFAAATVTVDSGPSAANGATVSITNYQLPGTNGAIAVTNLANCLTLGGGRATTYTLGVACRNFGTVTLNGATPVNVSNAYVTANSSITFTLKTVGGTVGAAPAIQTITPGTGFTVQGTALDTSVYNYTILR